jgi:hypothetical protein
MKKRPIIFFAHLARANQEGLKNQTRWVVKHKPGIDPLNNVQHGDEWLPVVLDPNGGGIIWLTKNQGGQGEGARRWGALGRDVKYMDSTTTWNGRQEDSDDSEASVFFVGKERAGHLDGRGHVPYPFLIHSKSGRAEAGG